MVLLRPSVPSQRPAWRLCIHPPVHCLRSEERQLFRQEWLVDQQVRRPEESLQAARLEGHPLTATQRHSPAFLPHRSLPQEAALETKRARLQAQLGIRLSSEPPRQAVGQWEGQPHGLESGSCLAHGLPFLPAVWEDVDAPGGLGQVSSLRGKGSSSSGGGSGRESGDEGGLGAAVMPGEAPGPEPRHD